MDINVTGDYTQHGDNVINKYVTINEAEPSRQALNTYIANRLAEFRKPETTEKYISLHFKIHLSKKESWISTNPAEIDPPNFMILGEIGCGKSTVLRKLALKAFEEQPAHKKLPIFLDLSTWPDGQEFEIFVKEYLKVHLGYELLFPCTQWVLFLDSLNEMSGDVELKINQLKQFLERYNLGQPNGIQAIIACQYKSYLKYETQFALPYLLVQELTEEQITQHIADGGMNLQFLLGRKFIRHPFQLSIINKLLAENEETDLGVYENFSQIFEAYINQVLNNQRNPQKYYYAPYVPEINIIKNCLGKLAFDMQKGQEGSTVTAGFALKSLASTLNLNVNINFVEKIKSLFSKSAAPLLTSVADQAQKTPHIFILRIAEKTGLIQIDKKGLTVQFTHEFYQKYFMAYFLTTQWQVYIKKNPQLYLGYSHFAGRGQGEKWDTGELREPQTWDEVWVVLVGLLNKAEQYYFLQFVTDYDPVLATEIIKKAGLSLENYRFIEKTLWECLEFENGYRKCDFGTTVYALSNFPTDETIKKLTLLLYPLTGSANAISSYSLWQIGQTLGITTLLQKMQATQNPEDKTVWGVFTHNASDFYNPFVFLKADWLLDPNQLDNYGIYDSRITHFIQELYVADIEKVAYLIEQNKRGCIEFVLLKQKRLVEAYEVVLKTIEASADVSKYNIVPIIQGILTNPHTNLEVDIPNLLNHPNKHIQEQTLIALNVKYYKEKRPPYFYSHLITQLEHKISRSPQITSTLLNMWFVEGVDHHKSDFKMALFHTLKAVSPVTLLTSVEENIDIIDDKILVLKLISTFNHYFSPSFVYHINPYIHYKLCDELIKIFESTNDSSALDILTQVRPPQALPIFVKQAQQNHDSSTLALAEMDLGERKNEVIQLLYNLMRKQQSEGAMRALAKLGEDITKDLVAFTNLIGDNSGKYFRISLLDAFEDLCAFKELYAPDDLNKNLPQIINSLQKIARLIPFKDKYGREARIIEDVFPIIIKILDKLAPKYAWEESFIILKRFYETAKHNNFEYFDITDHLAFVLNYIGTKEENLSHEQNDLLVKTGELIFTFYLWENKDQRMRPIYDDVLIQIIKILGFQRVDKAIPLLQKILENTRNYQEHIQQPAIEALGQFKNSITTEILSQLYTLRRDFSESDDSREEKYSESNHDKIASWVTEQIVVWGSPEAFKLLFDTLGGMLKAPRDFWRAYFLTDIYQVIRTINDASVLGNLIREWGKIPDVQLSADFAKGCFLHMPQAIPQLVKFIIEQDSSHRLQIVQLLIEMHIQAETFQKPLDIQYIYNELAKLRKDSDVQVRQEVNLYLGRYGDARAIEGLTEMVLNPIPTQTFIKSRPIYYEDDVTDDFKQQQYRLEFQEKCIALLVNIDSPKAKEELYSLAQNSNRHIKQQARKGLKFLKEREEKHKLFIPPLATT